MVESMYIALCECLKDVIETSNLKTFWNGIFKYRLQNKTSLGHYCKAQGCYYYFTSQTRKVINIILLKYVVVNNDLNFIILYQFYVRIKKNWKKDLTLDIPVQ